MDMYIKKSYPFFTELFYLSLTSCFCLAVMTVRANMEEGNKNIPKYKPSALHMLLIAL